MPLIDDYTRGNEQRARPRWPWVLVVIGFVILWLAIAVWVSFVSRAMSPQSRAAASVAHQQQYQRTTVAQAQAYLGSGDTATASALIDGIPAGASWEVMDKHAYLRTAAQVKQKAGDPAAAARFYERFLVMGAEVSQPECQGCHGEASGPAPRRVADLATSSLGNEYVSALRAAGTLQSTRKRLLRDLKKQPDSLRAQLLLFQVEKALGNRRAAAAHAEALKDDRGSR